ncbi:MAG: hypothetical protein IAE94_04840 [Chthoniobacterales bacterium]|nr:hypothetical protein [Chthoniobacterales bacterium]
MKNMGLSLLGAGCVTPLGRDWKTVWDRIRKNQPPEISTLQGPDCPAPVEVYKTPLPEVPERVATRLRRSAGISYFACAAAEDAVRNSGVLPGGRMALVYATSDGSVAYTRRFYKDVLARGTGSPLLFPETVYNAPASHIAAMLGLDGVVLTLVNDATVGLSALATAADLIFSGEADQCLVVAAEELDWITCEGYRRWGLTTPSGRSRRGAVLTEGAVALVVGPADPAHAQILHVHSGKLLSRGASRHRKIVQILGETTRGETPGVAVLSSSGPNHQEEYSVRECFSGIPTLVPKAVAGEAFAVSSLLQCLCGWESLEASGRAVIPVLGWSGQISCALLAAPEG